MSQPLPRYRFLLAALIFLIRTYAGFVILVPSIYTKELQAEFNASSAAIGTLVGSIMWGAAVLVLFSGPIVNKIGAKRSGLVGTVLMFVATFLTAMTTDYLAQILFRFMLGLGLVIATVAFMPITMTWFSAEEYGRVNGVIEASTSVGILLNFTFTPILFPPPLWREAHLAYGVIPVILTVLWAVFGREPRVEIKRKEENYLHILRTRLPRLFRIKEILFMGGVMWMAMGMATAFSAWIPNYFEYEWRWPLAASALLVSVYNTVNLLSWPFGGTLSDRVGLRRPFLMVGGVMVFVSVFMAVTFVGPATWVWYSLFGLFSAVYGFTITTIPMEHPDIKPEMISTAISIVLLFGFLGGAIMPTVLGAVRDLTGSLYLGLAVSSTLYLLISIIGLFAKETGWAAEEEKK